MIAYLAVNCSVILIAHFLALRYNANVGASAAIGSVVGSMVWIPYYLRSERVRVTFVH